MEFMVYSRNISGGVHLLDIRKKTGIFIFVIINLSIMFTTKINNNLPNKWVTGEPHNVLESTLHNFMFNLIATKNTFYVCNLWWLLRKYCQGCLPWGSRSTQQYYDSTMTQSIEKKYWFSMLLSLSHTNMFDTNISNVKIEIIFV